MEHVKTDRSFSELVCRAEKTSQSVRPALSVLVPVYNHEKYLRQCIGSIRMQKVNFKVEVLIAEDCSTDGSRRILQEMEREPDWPANFHILYRPHNLGMWENGEDLYRRAKGKYLIVLEGDDYWTYDHKLQEQYDFLERHPEFTGAAHRCQVVDDDGEPCLLDDDGELCLLDDDGEPCLLLLWKLFFHLRKYSPWKESGKRKEWKKDKQWGQIKKTEQQKRKFDKTEPLKMFLLWNWTYPGSPGRRHRAYTFRDWCLFRLPGQTATLMFRNFIEEDKEGRRVIGKNGKALKNYPRDQIKAFLLAVHGPIYCFPGAWSAYRYHPDSGTSFSGGQPASWEVRKAFYKCAVRYGKSRLSRKERSGLLLRMVTDRLACSVKKCIFFLN